jgi:uncharacterized protein YbjT (DUF2867 family)
MSLYNNQGILMSEKKILIVGATGTTGLAVINELQLSNIPIRAMVRNIKRAQRILNDKIEIVEGDLTKQESLINACEGIDRAYIATSISEDAVSLFNNFFITAKQVGVEHIVKLSGYGAQPESMSEILRQHYHSDQLLINSGINYTIIQPNSFFQNILWQSRTIRSKNIFRLPLADSSQSIIDVRDIAIAVTAIFMSNEHKNKIYKLTGNESLSCYDLADILSSILNRKISYKPITLDKSENEMIMSGMNKWNAHALVDIQQEFNFEQYKIITPDFGLITNKTPRKFSDFVHNHIELF